MSTLVFWDKGFRFQLSVCNGCHDILMISFGIKNFVMTIFYGIGYRCIIFGVSKGETIEMMNNSVLGDKGSLKCE